MTETLNDKDKWLAAEYALGVLDGDNLRLAEQRFEQESTFRQAVEDWQSELSPMLDEIDPVTPGAAVWDAIDKRISSTQPEPQSLWSSLAFWRGFSGLAGGLAAASLAALLFLPDSGLLVKPDPVQPLVATLTPTGDAPSFVARFEPDTGALFIRVSGGDAAETRVPELWVIPGDGVPRSLGVLNDDGLGNLSVSNEHQSLFGADVVLAVTLEPQGGAPEGKPTGPVIASGKLQSL